MPAAASTLDDPGVSRRRMAADPVVLHLRAKGAAYTRHGNLAKARDALRQLDVYQLGAHIKRVVGDAPLTATERDRLTLLLAPDGADGC